MRRAPAFLAVLVVLGVPASVGAQTVKHSPTAGWSRVYSQIAGINDWQSTPTNTVANTTGCVWNDADDALDAFTGKLSGGQTTQDSMCVVTDMCNDGFCPHMILFQVSGGNGLQVTLSNDRGGVWPSPPPVKGVYQLCISDPLWTGAQNTADYPAIPDTNGGVGFVTTYTLTVKAARTTQVGAQLEIAPNHSLGEFGVYRQNTSVPCPSIN